MSVSLGTILSMFDKLPFQKAFRPSYFLILFEQSYRPLYLYLTKPCSMSSGMTCTLNLMRSRGLAIVTDPAMKVHETRDFLILQKEKDYEEAMFKINLYQYRLIPKIKLLVTYVAYAFGYGWNWQQNAKRLISQHSIQTNKQASRLVRMFTNIAAVTSILSIQSIFHKFRPHHSHIFEYFLMDTRYFIHLSFLKHIQQVLNNILAPFFPLQSVSFLQASSIFGGLFIGKSINVSWLVKFDLIDGIIIGMIESSKLSKREQKHSKILQKQLEDLHRDVEAMQRRFPGNNNDSDEENQFVDKKGKKWWSRFDERHFAAIYQEDYFEIRDITTSNRLLQISPKQSLPLSTFPQEKITAEYDLFAERELIHVLYKSQTSPFHALTSYQLQQAIPNYSEARKEREALSGVKVTPVRPDVQIDAARLKQVKLNLVAINDDADFCKLVEDYKKTVEQFPAKNEVQRQIRLWRQELQTINQENNNEWDRLIKSIKHEVKYVPASESEISRIKSYLMWVTVLKYFEHGHSDKTMLMLQTLIENEKLARPAKGNDVNNKKLFQTDCKICFCSFNNDSNQVLYCDSCNTSFHLACYGLQEIPKEEIYYCDCCKFQKKNNSFKKVMCQLCNKTSFPIKQLEGHFYHVTCLILLNLAYVKSGQLLLREDKNHAKILEMVVQNEISLRQCQFCAKLAGSDIGVRLKCSYPNCTNCAHPICAYINGCCYQIKRDKKNERLDVRYFCNAHDKSRNWIEQTYIRRYMCNLKNTSSMSFQQFKVEYEEQIYKKHQSRPIVKRWDTSRITNKTKLLKRMLQKEQAKNQASQKIDTQSRRMLEKYKKIK